MLQVITGKAGTGKTMLLMQSVARDMERGQKNILIVPEQYSHQAERELCAVCGSRVSLYAQVLTFTGFARWVDNQIGSGAPVTLDKGGQLLCMALAVDMVYAQLRVYGSARKRANLQGQLLEAVTELKTACVTAEELLRAASDCDGILADKLSDMAMLLSAYDAVVSSGRADPTDKLTRLAERIPEVNIQPVKVYIDGFTDFTRQQLRVIDALLEAGCEITVCLTCDPTDVTNEVYAIPRSTLRLLERLAEERGTACETLQVVKEEENPLEFFCDHMFTYTKDRMDDVENRIRLYVGDSIADECEFAASEALRLVRETGCRWRDIAISVRGFGAYETILDSAFRKYGVPLYFAKKSPLMSKPLPQLISAAYEIISGGWAAEDMFTYLRTGLTGMERDDCDVLENYVLLWDLRGTAWTREGDWKMHPAGYEENYTPEDNALLRRVNVLRREAAAPLAAFAAESKAASNGHEQVMALVQLLDTLGVDRVLEQRADRLEQEGYLQQASECEKLWDVTMNALEQFDSILGEMELDTDRFSQLFLLMLGQYDIGTIPIAVDRVSAGEMDRMRRRNLKHLIVLGASDGNLPRPEESGGVFSLDDRSRLLEIGLDLGSCGDAELWREFGLIYNCLTLPKETLTLSYATAGDARPSVVFSRAKALFDHTVNRIDPLVCKMAARESALELAAFSLRDHAGAQAAAAAEYFRKDGDRLERLHAAAEQSRGRLSREGVTALYGKKLRLSASRIDRFNSCPFSYYMEYGLKAKPRQAASFAPPEMGTFMHYVLENVARNVTAQGGFAAVSDRELHRLTDQYINEYISRYLGDFKEKTPRFIYLFRRLTKDVRAVVSDMAAELRKSQFVPLDFELNFGDTNVIPPMEIGEGDASLTLTGIADRVDGWLHDGKLYLRVVDYKTGKKAFALSDIWHGMNLQMLLYLFTLEKYGQQRYEHEIVPAGVLYVPAFDKNISSAENKSDEEIRKEKAKAHKRSGLILNNDAVIAAMESGEEYEYIPVAVKGRNAGESLATAEQLGILAKHIDRTLQKLAAELKGGSIAASPYYKSKEKNACSYCDYKEICFFEDGKGGEKRRVLKPMKADEVWEQMELQLGGEQDGTV